MFGKRDSAVVDPELGDLTLEERQLVAAHRREQAAKQQRDATRREVLGDPDRPPQLTLRGEPIGDVVRPEMGAAGEWFFVPLRPGEADGVLLPGEVRPRRLGPVVFDGKGEELRIARLS